MAHQAKLSPEAPTSHVGVPVQAPATLSTIQLPANAFWKAADDYPTAWHLQPNVGDSGGVSGS